VRVYESNLIFKNESNVRDLSSVVFLSSLIFRLYTRPHPRSVCLPACPRAQSAVRLLNSQVRLLDHAKHVRFIMLRGAGTHLCGGADLRCVQSA
jgi:hypothetical protein